MKSTARHYHQQARAESSEATGRRIIDAFLARLLNQWFDEITLDRVAEDAGVTVQTIVRRFGSKDGLLASAVKVMAVQIEARRTAPAGNVQELVTRLIEDYEHTGDGVIRLLALEPRYPALQEVLEFGRKEHRRWVATAFAEPLSKLDAPGRANALDALVVAMDVYTWKLLRRDMGRSAAGTGRTMTRLTEQTIAASNKQNGR